MSSSAPLPSSSSSSSSSSILPPSSSVIPKSYICQIRLLSEPTPEVILKYSSLFPLYSMTVALLRHIHRVERLTITTEPANEGIIPLRLINELIAKKHVSILVDCFPVRYQGEPHFVPSIVVFTQQRGIVGGKSSLSSPIGYAIGRLPKSETDKMSSVHGYVYSMICQTSSSTDGEPFCSVKTFFEAGNALGGRLGASPAGEWFLPLLYNRACFAMQSNGGRDYSTSVSLASSLLAYITKEDSTLRSEEQTQLLAITTAVKALPTYDVPVCLCAPCTDNLEIMKDKIEELQIIPRDITSTVILYLGCWHWNCNQSNSWMVPIGRHWDK